MKTRVGSEAKRLFDALGDGGVRFFNMELATELSGKTYHATAFLLDHLVRAGWVVRVEKGLYAVAPGEGGRLNKLAVGRELAGGEGYYIGYGSAMEVWGMGAPAGGKEERTYPQPLPEGRGETINPHPPERGKEVIVTLTDAPLQGCCATHKGCYARRRLRRRRVLGVDYRFVNDALIAARKLENRRPRPEHWRLMEVEVEEGETVWVSDPEWTILSGLGRPDLCGGMVCLGQAVWSWRERLDLGKLVRYANHIRNRTAVRRLGFLLEALGLQTEESEFVLGFSVFSSYGRLEPGKPWAGELYRKWRLDVNTDLTTDGTDGHR